MTRVIDTMDDYHLDEFMYATFGVDHGHTAIRQQLERLFAEPKWSDSLDPDDNQTWVLCFVNDHSPEDKRWVRWIRATTDWGVTIQHYRDIRGSGREWKYATPIDLNIRYKEEGDE